MRNLIQNFILLAGLLAALPSAHAFSLGGPIGNGDDAYQKPIIGYGLAGDLNAPKKIGEEYRRVTPIMYYAADASFLNFFGTVGMTNIDAAFSILNNAFTNNPTGVTNGVDGYSADLSEVPTEAQEFNYTAQAAGLLDLKSSTLELMTEQLGLTQPERYVWTLHDRYLPGGGTCPIDEEYLVVQRNIDVINTPFNQLQYTSYINDALYSFYIFEHCNGANPLAVTLPFSVDPFGDAFTSVAGFNLDLGGFYVGLTRDDIGGLRYLVTSNNINFEATAPSGGTLITTNVQVPQILPTSSLAYLFLQAQTNPPNVLEAQFPGLQITSVTTNYNNFIQIPNVTTVLTNSQIIGAPIGNFAIQIVTLTNSFTPGVFTTYNYTFGNLLNASGTLITNVSTTNKITYTFQTIQITNLIGAPYGSIANTSIVNKTILTNGITGDYFILPPGDCGFTIITNFGPQRAYVTNINLTATPITNSLGFPTFTQQSVISYTNHYLYIQADVCTVAAAAPALREGIQKIQFIRANYDSLLGQFFQPLTNTYSMVMVTNYQAKKEYYQRIVTEPDFLMRAADLAAGPSAIPGVNTMARNLNFDQSQILAGQAGPGTITSPTTFTYDKVGDIYANGSLAFDNIGTNAFFGLGGLGQLTQGSAFGITNGLSILAWASFDGSTNDPVIYPNGTSIQNLINQIFLQVTPSSIPDGTVGSPYSVTFSATGGQPPYVFAAPNVSTLVPGLTFSGTTLSGTPTASGTYPFTIQLTDSGNRVVNLNYSITIH